MRRGQPHRHEKKERGEKVYPEPHQGGEALHVIPVPAEKNHGAPRTDKPDDRMLSGRKKAPEKEPEPENDSRSPGSDRSMYLSLPGMVNDAVTVRQAYGKRGDTEPPEQKQRSRDKEIFQREFHGNGLFRAEKPVSCIAETGNDITVVVQMTVKGCSENVHIRVISVDF